MESKSSTNIIQSQHYKIMNKLAFKNTKFQLLNIKAGARWLPPIVPTLWEAKAGQDPLRPGIPDQPEQHIETPSLQKI